MSPARTSLETPAALAAHHGATGLAVLDAGLRYAWVNPAWSELLELAPKRLLGEAVEALDPALAQLRPAAERVRDEGCTVQLRRVRVAPALGRALDADLGVVPLPEGGVLLELHALAPEAGPAAPRLSESLRGFAHEVKNPLAGLRGAAQLLRRRLADSDYAELADMIIAEADRLGALADRLLRASAKPHLAAVNLHEVLERVIALLSAEDRAPRILRDFDPSLPPLRADADRLTQLVLNLGRNAVEAGAATLTVRSRAEHGVHVGDRLVRTALRIDVHDDGRGVPAELSESLFLPLVSGRAEGTGLGLALCEEIAREHGGALTYRSQAGDTTFSLFLPWENAHG